MTEKENSLTPINVPAVSSIAAPPTEKAETPAAPLTSSSRKNLRFIFGAAAICGLIILSGFGWSQLANRNDAAALSAAPPRANLSFKRLVPDVWAYNPAISPDGRYLAYSQIENGKRSLWLKDIKTNSAVQIAPPLANGYSSAVFSPDGAQLYFSTLRPGVPNGVIARIPISGGAVEDVVGNVISPFAVSPDGSRLVFINGVRKLMIVNTNGSGERVLSDRERPGEIWFGVWASQMSWSPDGTRVAVCGGFVENGRPIPELFEISVHDGSERRILVPPDWNSIIGAAWLADGSGLLVTAQEKANTPFQIWRVPYPNPNREAERVTNDTLDYQWISLSADSRLLVAQQQLGSVNLWTAPFADMKQAKQITFGNAATDGYSGIGFAPDGKIVYSSKRSGAVDLWTANQDGSDQKQLTVNAGDWNGNPRVTPDNRFVVFQSTRGGENGVWRMDADGGSPKLLSGDGDAGHPSLSPDGNWVYYCAHLSVWKVSIEGGEPVRVSDPNLRAYYAFVSPDGKLIVYAYTEEDSATPWKVGLMDAGNGKRLKSFDVPHNRSILRWTADSKSFLHLDNSGVLWQQPIDDGVPPRQLTDFKNAVRNFAVSPDYRQVIFSLNDISHEAVLITDYANQNY